MVGWTKVIFRKLATIDKFEFFDIKTNMKNMTQRMFEADQGIGVYHR